MIRICLTYTRYYRVLYEMCNFVVFCNDYENDAYFKKIFKQKSFWIDMTKLNSIPP